MEEKQVFKAGDRIDQMCVTCNEVRGHIVSSVSKTGKITRVTCPICDTRGPYKAGSIGKGSNHASAPYDPTRTYRKGQMLMHSMFGEGEVTAIIEPQKMDVLFADRVRRLIHGHS
jgi:transcription elongation factor Elf1